MPAVLGVGLGSSACLAHPAFVVHRLEWQLAVHCKVNAPVALVTNACCMPCAEVRLVWSKMMRWPPLKKNFLSLMLMSSP